MSSSRDKKESASPENKLQDEFTLFDWKYPYSAKRKSDYLTPFKTYEDLQEKTSTHPVNRTIKSKDDIDLEQLKKTRKLADFRFYYLKNNKPGSPASEFEALCAAFYGVLAPDNVPSTHAIFEEQEWCSLLYSDKKPTSLTLEDLAITTNCAYVRYGEELYYVNKEKKECLLIKNPDKETMRQFDETLEIDELKQIRNKSKILSNEELSNITRITSHIHGDGTKSEAKFGYETHRYVAVTSKAIKNFRTNHDVPLEEQDILIELINDLIEEKNETNRAQLNINVEELKIYLENIASQGSTQSVRDFFNFFVSSAYTSVKLRDTLTNFINTDSKVKFSPPSLEALLDFVRNRIKHIEVDLKDTAHNGELERLKQIATIAETLLNLALQKEASANRKLEEAYRSAIARGTDIVNGNDEEIINCDGFSIKLKELKNYRIVKRLAVALVVRYLMQDTDGHNQNMSKDGWLIDFDMSLLRIQFQFRDPSFWDCLLRKPNDRTFIITARDIANFPILFDADFFYWPTKATIITKSMAKKISLVYSIKENFFEKKDNEVFKKLATNPVFVFHKYKTLLKFILTDGAMYRSVGKLHMREELMYKDWNDGKVKNLLDEIVANQKDRIQKLRDVLLGMPEFQKFMAYNGKYVMNLLKEEFLTYRNKYKKKLKEHPGAEDLKDVINSINLEDIHKKYTQIYEECGADKIQKEGNEPFNKVRELHSEFAAMFKA